VHKTAPHSNGGGGTESMSGPPHKKQGKKDSLYSLRGVAALGKGKYPFTGNQATLFLGEDDEVALLSEWQTSRPCRCKAKRAPRK